MSVLNLHTNVPDNYRDFLRSFLFGDDDQAVKFSRIGLCPPAGLAVLCSLRNMRSPFDQTWRGG